MVNAFKYADRHGKTLILRPRSMPARTKGGTEGWLPCVDISDHQYSHTDITEIYVSGPLYQDKAGADRIALKYAADWIDCGKPPLRSPWDGKLS